MFLDLSAKYDRETIVRALEQWKENRQRRADELQPLAPMLSLAVREEAARTAAILAKVQP